MINALSYDERRLRPHIPLLYYIDIMFSVRYLTGH